MIQTQGCLTPEPAHLTAAIFFLPFPGTLKCFVPGFEVSYSTAGPWKAFLVDRHVATLWSQLTAALPSSQPIADI